VRRRHTSPRAKLIDQARREASWLLPHAQALDDYGPVEEAAGDKAGAGACEEQVACLLDADGQELEAAIHRVSAASCYEQLGQHTRAVTLLPAAPARPLHSAYPAPVEQLLPRCLAQAQKEAPQAAETGCAKR